MDPSGLEPIQHANLNTSVEADSYFGISCDEGTNSSEIQEGNYYYISFTFSNLGAWVKWLRMQGHRLPATLKVTG